MPVVYGAIGFTLLTNNNNNNNVIIFSDMHDKLEKCKEYINISDWLKNKINTSKILLEEVDRNNNEFFELWKSSEHTQNLKNLYLNNINNIKAIDIRPIMIPFNWEILELENNNNLTSKKKITLFV